MGTMEIGTYGYNENWDILVQWKLGYMGSGHSIHTGRLKKIWISGFGFLSWLSVTLP